MISPESGFSLAPDFYIALYILMGILTDFYRRTQMKKQTGFLIQVCFISCVFRYFIYFVYLVFSNPFMKRRWIQHSMSEKIGFSIIIQNRIFFS